MLLTRGPERPDLLSSVFRSVSGNSSESTGSISKRDAMKIQWEGIVFATYGAGRNGHPDANNEPYNTYEH